MRNHTRGRYAAPRKPRTPLLTMLLLLGLVFAGCASTAEADGIGGKAAELDQTVLETARATCAPGSSSITAGDGGSTLLIDHKGEADSFGASIEDVACVLFALGLPDSVTAQIDSTRALDGRQSASWDGYAVSWAYHPDSGIDMIVTEG